MFGLGMGLRVHRLFLLPSIVRLIADRMRLGDDKCGFEFGPWCICGRLDRGEGAGRACRPPGAPPRTRQPRVRPMRRSEVKARELSRRATRPRVICSAIWVPMDFMARLITGRQKR